MFAAMGSLSNELVVRDTRGMLSFLADQTQVASGPKGCIGYCMSGQYVRVCCRELSGGLRRGRIPLRRRNRDG